MGAFSSRIKENDLLTELEKLNVEYMNLYKTYEYVKAREASLHSKNNDLRKQLNRILDHRNIDTFMTEHNNKILDDAFEMAYISKYHSYLETLTSVN